jgi:ketosteroid isomerase-like protein
VEETISNRRLAQAFMGALNNRNYSEFQKRLRENAVLDFPGPGRIENRKKIISFMKALFRRFPQLEFTIHDVIVEGNRACIVWTNIGERNDGEPYSNSGITLLHITDGKIDSISDYFKDTSFVTT